MYFLTPWVKRLLVANVAVHVVVTGMPAAANAIYEYGALVPAQIATQPWAVFTYMFIHSPGLMHILLNMLGLFMFGPRLEQRLGGRDFITLYLLSGIGGAAFSFIFAPQYPIIGASAAVYGVLVGFAMFWPRERLYIYGILPIEAWLMIVLLVAFSLWSGMNGGGIEPNVAHFAHLGGIASGFGFLKWREWRRGAPRRDFQLQLETTPSSTVSDRTALSRWESIDTALLHELNRQEVETLLRRAKAEGVRVLTPAERAFLDRMATQH